MAAEAALADKRLRESIARLKDEEPRDEKPICVFCHTGAACNVHRRRP